MATREKVCIHAEATRRGEKDDTADKWGGDNAYVCIEKSSVRQCEFNLTKKWEIL